MRFIMRISHSFSFRAGTVMFTGFLVIMIFFRGFIYWQHVHVFHDDFIQVINAHIEEISENIDHHGPDYAMDLVHAITSDINDQNVYIGLKYGVTIAGNIPQWPHILPDRDHPELTLFADDDGSPLHVYCQHSTRAMADLLVCYDLQEIDHYKKSLGHVMAQTMIAALLLSLALSMVLIYMLNKHISKINIACQNVINGDLTYRINTLSHDDQFDILARNINRMLDWINVLIATTRESSNGLAHDLRTPISHHRLQLASVLNDPLLTPDTRTKLNQSLERIDYIIEIFDNILRIAKAESGTATELIEWVDIGQIILDIADFYDPLIQERHLSVSISVPEQQVMMRGDRQLLSQAMMNLLDNAIKFSPDKGTITITLIQDHQITIVMMDEGGGMEVNDLEHATERFYRSDKSRNTPGTGLGLSLVLAVARLHHGTLALMNNQSGLIARLTFPVQK